MLSYIIVTSMKLIIFRDILVLECFIFVIYNNILSFNKFAVIILLYTVTAAIKTSSSFLLLYVKHIDSFATDTGDTFHKY